MDKSLDEKVIAITGAGKGLGRAYALHLAGLGARIVVNNRRHEGEQQSSADSTVDAIVAQGGSAVPEYSDVEDAESGERLLAAALERYGRLDGVIANAGITEGVTFCKQTPEQFRHVIEINIFGTANIVRPAFRHMHENGAGRIVVSTSGAGLFGEFGLPAYSASKAAVVGLMRSLALEGKPRGVHVNALSPYAATAMTQAHLSDEVCAVMDAASVAPAAAWLVSDYCNTSGNVFVAAGGRIAHVDNRSTQTHAMPAIDSETWKSLGGVSHDLAFENAGRHFDAFVGDSSPP